MRRADSLSVAAPAKINLSLQIKGRRADGYHLLESLVGFSDIGDELIFRDGAEFSFSLSGPFADGLAGQPNLVEAAHGLMQEAAQRKLACHIELIKNLPVASGIGGGSADAAAALTGLIQFFDLRLDDGALKPMAQKLGADVPVCLSAQPAWMCGIGHEVTRLADLPPADIVLVNPLIGVSTAQVFGALNAPLIVAAEITPAPALSDLPALLTFIKMQGNGLAVAAQNITPVIKDCLAALKASGALVASMSGSGATCFALAQPGQGAAIEKAYQVQRGDDWVKAGRLISARDTKIDQPQ
jgi:4-diphosphocytidyl-2-C-methyl-D-erythritol kinase